MKTTTKTSLLFAAGLALLVAGCALWNGEKPPAAWESKFYDFETNLTEKVTTKTVTVTNTVVHDVTNINNVVVPVTNLVVEKIQVKETNTIPVYIATPKASDAAITAAIGSGANTVIPGSGAAVTAGAGLLLTLWGWFRSYKRGQTNTALSQEMETVLEFINALPNGGKYYSAVIQFLKDHQSEAGVVTQVIGLLKNEVSNPDAKVAAQQVIDTINGLESSATKIAPVSLVD
jgi:hypothetical protein